MSSLKGHTVSIDCLFVTVVCVLECILESISGPDVHHSCAQIQFDTGNKGQVRKFSTILVNSQLIGKEGDLIENNLDSF
jgi:hypothetical protein